MGILGNEYVALALGARILSIRTIRVTGNATLLVEGYFERRYTEQRRRTEIDDLWSGYLDNKQSKNFTDLSIDDFIRLRGSDRSVSTKHSG